MLTPFLIMVAAQAANPVAASSNLVQTTLAEPDVPKMSPRDIKTFNQTVPANHPYHIRCTHQVDVGSLVAGTTTCKTNQQWAKTDQIGNENAREIGDRMASKFTTTN